MTSTSLPRPNKQQHQFPPVRRSWRVSTWALATGRNSVLAKPGEAGGREGGLLWTGLCKLFSEGTKQRHFKPLLLDPEEVASPLVPGLLTSTPNKQLELVRTIFEGLRQTCVSRVTRGNLHKAKRPLHPAVPREFWFPGEPEALGLSLGSNPTAPHVPNLGKEATVALSQGPSQLQRASALKEPTTQKNVVWPVPLSLCPCPWVCVNTWGDAGLSASTARTQLVRPRSSTGEEKPNSGHYPQS